MKKTDLRIAAVWALSCLAGGAARAQPPPSPLPVKQVTLFTSGVAYTERDGAVEGNATVPLVFHTAQINDILKSMVLIDRGGKVQPATFASRDPIGRTLQSFAVDVSQDLSQSDLLSKLRGARVSVETGGNPTLTGQIIGVEDRQVGGTDTKPITATYLNILTETGLTAVRLDQDRVVRILDDRLNHELHEALSTLATGMDNQRRQVTLHFAGVGKRAVRVAYVMEAPIWKISYRLVLGDSTGKSATAKPYLQGWAIVENTSDEDWKGVKLSLVSGRPVSFIQDLYQPLYIPRPEIGPDVVASPYPQTHDDNLLAADKPANRVAANSAPRGEHSATGYLLQQPPMATPLIQPTGLLPGGINSSDLLGLSNKNVISSLYRGDAEGEVAFKELQKSVRSMASGSRVGQTFQYSIAAPINLPRQQAAMIPVVAQDISTDRLSIYNALTDGQYAMSALRIHNTTALYLKGGPITLFDGGAYAGDAKIEDVPPGDTRLISYAVDLSILGSRDTPGERSTKTTISVKRGLFIEKQSIQDEVVYTLKSKSDKSKTVLVEHPYIAGYSLTQPPTAAERTATVYRFPVTVPAHKTQTLKVITEHILSTTVAISDMKSDRFAFYATNGAVSPKLKTELQEVVRRRKQVDDLKAESTAKTAEFTAIDDDQDRIRKNMAALDHSSALYRRYVSELDAQESGIAALRLQAKNLDRRAAAAETALKSYVDGINE